MGGRRKAGRGWKTAEDFEEEDWVEWKKRSRKETKEEKKGMKTAEDWEEDWHSEAKDDWEEDWHSEANDDWDMRGGYLEAEDDDDEDDDDDAWDWGGEGEEDLSSFWPAPHTYIQGAEETASKHIIKYKRI